MKHKVGDIVTIREWDDMASEFENDGFSIIKTKGKVFVSGMKKFCGKSMKISLVIGESEGCGIYAMKNDISSYMFSDSMFTDWLKENDMKNYKDVTLVEYMEKKKEMFKNLGSEPGWCDYRICGKCGFLKAIRERGKSCAAWEMENPEEAARIVMEYEPEVDWSKVPVDTKVLVRNTEEKEWSRRHFAKFEDGKVYVFPFGETSYTMNHGPVDYVYAKLYKEE